MAVESISIKREVLDGRSFKCALETAVKLAAPSPIRLSFDDGLFIEAFSPERDAFFRSLLPVYGVGTATLLLEYKEAKAFSRMMKNYAAVYTDGENLVLESDGGKMKVPLRAEERITFRGDINFGYAVEGYAKDFLTLLGSLKKIGREDVFIEPIGGTMKGGFKGEAVGPVFHLRYNGFSCTGDPFATSEDVEVCLDLDQLFGAVQTIAKCDRKAELRMMIKRKSSPVCVVLDSSEKLVHLNRWELWMAPKIY